MIAVFGCGVVGEAFARAVEHRQDSTKPSIVRRIDPKRELQAQDHEIQLCSLTFVCVPTPTKNGQQDLSAVYSVLRRLIAMPYKGLVVLRSTITPSNVMHLQSVYPLRIAALPEFLTEANANEDAERSPFFVVGTCGKDQHNLLDFLTNLWPGDVTQYFYTTPAGAMLIKYWVNCSLASRVALANEFKLYWDTVGDGLWTKVSRGFSLDHRCGDSHMRVPGPDSQLGFGGKCFPKDVQAMAGEIASMVEQWDGGVLDGALEVNKRVRGEQDAL